VNLLTVPALTVSVMMTGTVNIQTCVYQVHYANKGLEQTVAVVHWDAASAQVRRYFNQQLEI